VLPSSLEADGLRHHLFITHPGAAPTKNAIFMLLFETLLPYSMRGCQILDDL
jgi:hypothetical protein